MSTLFFSPNSSTQTNLTGSEKTDHQMGLLVSGPSFHMCHVVALLCLGSVFLNLAGSVKDGNETDRLALLAFKGGISRDPFGALNSWNESIHFCQWIGVTCGRRHKRVTSLRLDDQKLTGSISPHIGNLSFLKQIWLRNNSLSGQIPPEIGRLRRLRAMTLLNNSVSGQIPANISGCSNLVALELSGNFLSGKIPVELGHLYKLKGIYVRKNSLIGGIPSAIGNLSSLIDFMVQYNSISGTIPDALGRLTNLEILGLGANKLVGTIPFSIFNLSSITALDVPDNQIEGGLPSDLGNSLPNLRFLGTGMNLFTGPFPISLSNASELDTIDMPYNKHTGKIPSLEKLKNLWWLSVMDNHLGTGEANDLSFLPSLTNATYLYYLGLSGNNFGGSLTESINNFSADLSQLLLANNKVQGSIPTGMWNLANLEVLDLTNNLFIGNIPVDIVNLQKMQYLSLSSNRFSGNIPLYLGNLSLLTNLYLEENSLQGSIPSSLGKCQSLVALFLSQNNLTSSIPREIFSLSSLLQLNLSQNHLSESFPVEVGKLINLEELDISDNKLSGKIPSTLGSCIKLRLLYMESNNFTGILPSSLGSLRVVEELDLSRNNLSGKIPLYLQGFIFLQRLNLSFNKFEGAVPVTGIFKNATAVSVKGNNQLCGGIPELQLHSCNSKVFKRKRFTAAMKLVIPIALGVLGLIVILCFLYFRRQRDTGKTLLNKFVGNTLLDVSYRRLLKATNGFSTANLIGVGSFGSVYKGILDQGGKVVAVKVLNLQTRGASKSFMAECRALKGIRHRNLVKVLTACSSVDYKGNEFKALVYEFMVNGSLEEWLHPNEKEGVAHEKMKNLNLQQKLNIAIDIASGLDYLHHHCVEPIIHCDLKPSNVLLDEEMTAHLGDFGLARFLQGTASDSSANQSSIGIRGSTGYAAPEYGMGNEVSTSGDVYSYGILLLEMLTGKRPTDSMFIDGLNLHNFAKMALSEQVVNIGDPSLFQQIERGETSLSIANTQNQSSPSDHKIQESLVLVLEVGIACSEELPRDRLSMDEVVRRLHLIRKTLFETVLQKGKNG